MTPVLPAFAALFGRAPTLVASAHGRVNLIGEHTDYNDGLVLPTAIPHATHVAVAPRADRRVVLASAQMPDGRLAEYELGAERRTGTWIDYAQGVTFALLRAGFEVGGFDARIDSDVPVGAGVSSSAALEVALLRALRAVFDLDLNDERVAVLGREAENDLVGAPVGIMDQMCASLSTPGDALSLDCRSLRHERVVLPRADLVVIHSGVIHRLADGDGGYATRRLQCEDAARQLGVASLRDLDVDDLDHARRLPQPLGRRVRHVVTENARVTATVAAIREERLNDLGELFAASHASMRDDYEVSAPEVDALVEIASADADVIGARLTGGGFGGSIVAFAVAGHGRAAAHRIAARYQHDVGQHPVVLVPQALER